MAGLAALKWLWAAVGKVLYALLFLYCINSKWEVVTFVTSTMVIVYSCVRANVNKAVFSQNNSHIIQLHSKTN